MIVKFLLEKKGLTISQNCLLAIMKTYFFILDLSIIDLFSCLVTKGALFPQSLCCFKGAFLLTTSLKTNKKLQMFPRVDKMSR